MNFLDLMQTSNFLGNEIHFQPQLSAAEKSGLVVPELLKLEDGLDGHLRSIERLFDLPEAKFQKNPEIRKLLASHAKQKSRNVFSDPYKLVPFMRTPDASSLLTKDSKKRIYELYAADFEAYGYVADM